MSIRASERPVDGEIMASVDEDGDAPRLVIADISTDESWLSIAQRAAVSIAEWR